MFGFNPLYLAVISAVGGPGGAGFSPSWSVTPEYLPPGYVYTGGLRTQVQQDGSIGWAPHNLLSDSGLKAGGVSTLSVDEAAGAVTDDGLDVSTTDPLGGMGARRITFSASSGLFRLRPASGASQGIANAMYSGRVWLKTADGSTRTVRFQVNDLPSGAAGEVTLTGAWQEFTRSATSSGTFQFMDVETSTGGFSVHVWGAHLNLGQLQPYLATTDTARYEPRTADYSDSMGPVLGPELVADPSFDSPASWSTVQPASGSVVVSGGNASINSADGSYASADSASGSPAVIGRLYRCTIVVTSVSGGGVRALVGGRAGTARTAPGTYVEDLVALSASRPGVIRAGGVSGGVVASISVKEITGYAGTLRGIKIEPQATNLLTHSADLENAAWTTGGMGRAVAAVYWGAVITKVVRLTVWSPSSTHQINSPQLSMTGSFTYRVLVKADGVTKVALREFVTSGQYVSFDLARGVVIATGGGATGTATPGPSGSWWLSATYSFGSANNAGISLMALQESYTTGTPLVAWAGDDVSSILCAAPQWETGTVGTSYIPTYGSQVTRAAESITYPQAAIAGFNATQGTFVMRFTVKPDRLNGFGRLLANESAQALIARNGGAGVLSDWGGGSASSATGPDAATQFVRAALRWSGQERRMALNGTAGASQTAGAALSLTELRIWGAYGNGSFDRIDYYPTAASDEQLQALTA